jgi:hypothetical protein
VPEHRQYGTVPVSGGKTRAPNKGIGQGFSVKEKYGHILFGIAAAA